MASTKSSSVMKSSPVSSFFLACLLKVCLVSWESCGSRVVPTNDSLTASFTVAAMMPEEWNRALKVQASCNGCELVRSHKYLVLVSPMSKVRLWASDLGTMAIVMAQWEAWSIARSCRCNWKLISNFQVYSRLTCVSGEDLNTRSTWNRKDKAWAELPSGAISMLHKVHINNFHAKNGSFGKRYGRAGDPCWCRRLPNLK